MINILYFGRIADVSGMSQEVLQLSGNIITTSDLRAHLDARFEAGGALLEPSVRLAINSEIVRDPYPIKTGDEVAFMPPVGGG